jgi:hypothetical protein
MGPLAAGLIAPLLSALKRKLFAYALMAASGLIVIFAVGYGLDAVHSMLMFRYGGVAASLVISGALILTALVSSGLAFYLNERPHTSAAVRSSPYSNAPLRRTMSGKSAMAIAAAVAGAVTAATVIRSSKRLRKFFAGDDTGKNTLP